MPLTEIAEIIQTGLTRSNFTDSLKFDCGEAGVITLANKQVSLLDARTACTLTLSRDNLEKLIKGKLNPMTAVMMGKIKVAGDPSVAMKLGQLLKS